MARQQNPARRWVFTLNNPEFDASTLVEQHEWGPDLRYAIWQVEKGAQGTRHIQGYIELRKPQRLSYCRGVLPTAHWEVAKGNKKQCRDYCSKEDTREEGPWEHGQADVDQGSRTDLTVVQEAIDGGASEREVAREHFTQWCKYYRAFQRYRVITVDERDFRTELIVVCGAPGVGKSYWATHALGKSYVHTTDKWWCTYQHEPVTVFNDFHGGFCPWTELLQLADRYPHTVQTKGGYVPFTSQILVLTSNSLPEQWYNYGPTMLFGALARRITMFIYWDVTPETSYWQDKYPDGPRHYGQVDRNMALYCDRLQ